MPSTSETPTYSDESSYTPLVEYWLQTQTSAKQVPCLGGTRGGGGGLEHSRNYAAGTALQGLCNCQ